MTTEADLRALGFIEKTPGYWQRRDDGTRAGSAETTPEPVQGSTSPLTRSPYKSRLEAEYAGRLEARRITGDIEDWRYEGVTLKLANGVRITPDFYVERWTACYPPDLELHEVKGFMRDDARVKLRVAAAQYPAFTFFLARKIKGVWSVTEVPKE